MINHFPRIIFCAHGDHNFQTVKCKKEGDVWTAHLDNLLGVYTLTQAYFSGQMPTQGCSINITYGEEGASVNKYGKVVDFAGAREVMETVTEEDLVVVLDVTSLPEQYKNLDFSIEKCQNPFIRDFLKQSLKEDFKFQIFQWTPDTEAFQDETDAFRQVTKNVFFFGLPVYGGDYNRVPVKTDISKNQKCVEAIVRIANEFSKNWKTVLEKMPKSQKKLSYLDFQEMVSTLNQLQLQCDEEDLESEQQGWTDIFRKLKFAKKGHRFHLPAEGLEHSKDVITFIAQFKKSKSVEQKFNEVPKQQLEQYTFVFEIKSKMLTEMLWNSIEIESIFQSKYIEQAFTLVDSHKMKTVVIHIKQKKINKMVMYIHE